MLNETDLNYLRRCVQLAEETLNEGNEPFGSLLVAADGTVLLETKNLVGAGDNTQHPEFAIARWAAQNLTSAERATATVYTSGEHCPMCSAAHGWVDLGRIVYASSSAQLGKWLRELGAPASPIKSLPIQHILPDLIVEGPVPELAAQVRELHRRLHAARGEEN